MMEIVGGRILENKQGFGFSVKGSCILRDIGEWKYISLSFHGNDARGHLDPLDRG